MPDVSTFTLGSLTLTLYDDEPDLGTPDRALGVESNALSDEPVQTTDYVSAFRDQTYPVRIVGVASIDESANDNVVRQLHNLTLELAKATNTLVLAPRVRHADHLSGRQERAPDGAVLDHLRPRQRAQGRRDAHGAALGYRRCGHADIGYRC